MKQTTFIAILLTFLMLLLVSVAAVIFLFQRNQALEQTTAVQSNNQASIRMTAEHLGSDLAVRQGALESVEATREALSGELTIQSGDAQELEIQLEERQAELSQVENELENLAFQLFIFSPKDEAVVQPKESIEIIVAVQAGEGISNIQLFANSELLADYSAGGHTTATFGTEWIPPEEGQFVLQAIAHDNLGQISQPVSVTITADYGSEANRAAALIKETVDDARALRVPNPPAAQTEATAPEPEMLDLHRLLLTGRESDDQQERLDELLVSRALDLLPSGVDPSSYAEALYGDELLAYFDPDTQELTIYDPKTDGEALGRWTHVHTVAHELQDELFGLNEIDFGALDADARIALRALVEGDATYLQYLYRQGNQLEPEDQAAIAEDLTAAATESLSALPAYMRENFGFAYSAGLPFIQHLYEQGGFDAVDAAWSNKPTSTEQILHPERYLADDKPVIVSIKSITGALNENWRLVDQGTFGEFHLRQHLEQQALNAQEIDQAATGWGGGSYAVYANDEEEASIVLMRMAWDEAADRREFASVYPRYLGQRYDGGGTALPDGGVCWEGVDATCFYVVDGETLIIRAPDLELITSVFETQ